MDRRPWGSNLGSRVLSLEFLANQGHLHIPSLRVLTLILSQCVTDTLHPKEEEKNDTDTHIIPWWIFVSEYTHSQASQVSGKESTCQCRRHNRHRFNPWVEKIPWRRKWQPTLAFLPGQRSLADTVPRVARSQTWLHSWARMHTHSHTHAYTLLRNKLMPLVHKVYPTIHFWVSHTVFLRLLLLLLGHFSRVRLCGTP